MRISDWSSDVCSSDLAARSPLAQALFQVDGVTGVFLGYDFISVSKRDGKEWYLMKPGVLGVIMEHFVAGRPTILDSTVPDAGADTGAAAGEDSEIVAQIQEQIGRASCRERGCP